MQNKADLESSKPDLFQLQISSPASEEERMANEVGRSSGDIFASEEQENKVITRAQSSSHATDKSSNSPKFPSVVRKALNSSGRPLPLDLQKSFATFFGSDLSDVRIHTDVDAAKTAKSVYADAFTISNHIVFGPGKFKPDTEEGRSLIAHEVAHVVQQKETKTSNLIQRQPAKMPPPPQKGVAAKADQEPAQGIQKTGKEKWLASPAYDKVKLFFGLGDEKYEKAKKIEKSIAGAFGNLKIGDDLKAYFDRITKDISTHTDIDTSIDAADRKGNEAVASMFGHLTTYLKTELKTVKTEADAAYIEYKAKMDRSQAAHLMELQGNIDATWKAGMALINVFGTVKDLVEKGDVGGVGESANALLEGIGIKLKNPLKEFEDKAKALEASATRNEEIAASKRYSAVTGRVSAIRSAVRDMADDLENYKINEMRQWKRVHQSFDDKNDNAGKGKSKSAFRFRDVENLLRMITEYRQYGITVGWAGTVGKERVKDAREAIYSSIINTSGWVASEEEKAEITSAEAEFYEHGNRLLAYSSEIQQNSDNWSRLANMIMGKANAALIKDE